MMTGTEFDIEIFDEKNDFGLWQVRMKALLEQQGLAAGGSQSEYIDEFHKLVGDLAAIDTAISDEDQALLLLTSLPSSYDNFVETLLYSRDTLKLEDVLATLNSRELQKMTKAKGDGGEGLYNHKKSQGFVRNEDRVSSSGADEYDNTDVMMENAVYVGTCKVQVQMRDGSSFVLDNVRYVPELRRNLISLGTLEKEGFTVKLQSGKIKVIKGSLVVLSGTRRANCVYTLDGQAVTRKTLKAIGFKMPIDMLGLFGLLASIKQEMLELVKVKCIFLGYHESIVGDKLWRLDDVTSKVVLYRNMGFNESEEYKKTFIGYGVDTGSVHVLQGVEFEVKPQEDHTFEVKSHGNVDHVAGSHETQTQDLMDYHSARDREQHSSREFGYKEDNNEAAFVVAAVEKIYAHESLTFNDTVACEVISKWKAELKEEMDAQSDAYVLSNGCKKSSDDKNDYYWEYTPGMFIHLFLYIDDMVFSCGCKAEMWVTKGLLDKAKGNVLGIEIIRDQSGNTLRVSHSRFYNRKLVQTLLEGRSILSMKGSLSRDCNVEKNGKWSYTYAVESQVYQGVCTRPDIASVDVGMYDSEMYDIYQGLEERSYLAKGTLGRVREVLEAKTVEVLKVGTEQNAADALTKVSTYGSRYLFKARKHVLYYKIESKEKLLRTENQVKGSVASSLTRLLKYGSLLTPNVVPNTKRTRISQ
ncbi:hypothetical protein Tco_0281098 [Tanacetum coccineum]